MQDGVEEIRSQVNNGDWEGLKKVEDKVLLL